jgi:hypothetical protein
MTFLGTKAPRIVQGIKRLLLLCFLIGEYCTQVEDYISSSISSKINTLTAPDRLRVVRRSLTRELGLWR